MAKRNTIKRVLVSILAIPIILYLCYIGEEYFFTFVLFIALISYYEFTTFIKNENINPNLWLGFLSILFLLVNGRYNIISTNTFLLLFVFILTLSELFRKGGNTVSNIGSTLLAVLYIGFFANSFIGIRELYPNIGELYQRGGFIVISIFATIWVCDSAAFFGGTALGKHKLMPRVSPKKSWEGAIFGFVFAIITMVVAKFVILDFLSWENIFVLGIIIGLVGQIGDLVESLFKRSADVKDSSNLIPGHGGIFDRFDSLLFSAPIVYLYLSFLK